MAFQIEFTQSAANHVRKYRKFDQEIILKAISEQLTYEPQIETRNRKQLAPNELASWELRIQKFRVFYDVSIDGERDVVKIVAIGHKEHNTLHVGGKEVQL